MNNEPPPTRSPGTHIRSFSTIMDLPVVNPVPCDKELPLGFIDISALGSITGMNAKVSKTESYYCCPQFAFAQEKGTCLLPSVSNYRRSQVPPTGEGEVFQCGPVEALELYANHRLRKLPIAACKSSSRVAYVSSNHEVDVIALILTSTRCYPFVYEKRYPGFPWSVLINGHSHIATKRPGRSAKLMNYEFKFSVIFFYDSNAYTIQSDHSSVIFKEKITLKISKQTFNLRLTESNLNSSTDLLKPGEGLPLFTIDVDSSDYHFPLKLLENYMPMLMQDGSSLIFNKAWWTFKDKLFAKFLIRNDAAQPNQYSGHESGLRLLELRSVGTASVLKGSEIHSSAPLLRMFAVECNEVPVYEKCVKINFTLQ